ncbi:MAG: hypothetical protein IT313_02615 [Anaerolineales bacterium]|nr:hypothetical protein [Anaerolineales bacterium]
MSFETHIREIELVKQNFSFLFDQGFRIIYAEPAKSFNNWLLDMASPILRIQFAEDRSELIIRVGPNSAGIGWQGNDLWDLQLLIFHLKKDTNMPPQLFFSKDMESAAEVFKSYFTDVTSLFQQQDYLKLANSLKKSYAIMMKKWHPKVYKGIFR